MARRLKQNTGTDEELLETFLNDIWLADGLSSRTIHGYRHDLEQLRATLAGAGRRLLEATQADLNHHLALLSQRPDQRLDPRSGQRSTSLARVRRALAAIRRLYRWCMTRNLLAEDPSDKLQSPRPTPPFPKALSPGRMRRLLETEAGRNDPERLRNRAMVELAYGCGLRASELVGVTLQRVSLNDGHVQVVGKGNKERLVPLNPICAEALEAWIQQGRPAYLKGRKNTDALFISRLGRPLTANGFWRLATRLGKAAGLPGPPVTPHVFRHSFATDLVGNGADLRAVQLLLGHESIQTTGMYVRTSRKKLKALHAKHHPRG